MPDAQHRIVETNSIRMHIAEQGTGPLVVLLHGFPESWYSWRHQLGALAEAGYHAVAPICAAMDRLTGPRGAISTPNSIWWAMWSVSWMPWERSRRWSWGTTGVRRWLGIPPCCGRTACAA